MRTVSKEEHSEAPLVSAIIIFWNDEQFLGEAIESVLAQTYEHWELFLVDDGSTDESSYIARDYADRYSSKIRYLEHPNHQNLGMSASRNLGIGQASGKYVAFLDSDDVWLSDKLAHQVRLLEHHLDAFMVYGPTQFWYSWCLNPDDERRDFFRPIGETGRLFDPPALLTWFLETSGKVPGICSLLVRREAVLEVGGFEDAFRGSYEDQVFLSKVCVQYPVFVDDRCSARYRQHPGSSTTLARQSGAYHPMLPHPTREIYLTWLASYLTSRGVEDEQLWAALTRELQPYRHPFLHGLSKRVRHSPKLVKNKVERVVQRTPLAAVLRRVAAWWRGREYHPRAHDVDFGSLRRVTPVSLVFGRDRGFPIDRHYIESFLAKCEEDVRGRTLETGSRAYTEQFGGNRVTGIDVLHLVEGNPKATMTGDLTAAPQIPSESYDCIILTQTLQFVYDLRAAISTVYRILRPSGVVLATFPGISPVGADPWSEGWYWSLTSRSARRLFEERFRADGVQVEAFGNVLTAAAFLAGLATQELGLAELGYKDPRYEVIVAVRAVKPGEREVAF